MTCEVGKCGFRSCRCTCQCDECYIANSRVGSVDCAPCVMMARLGLTSTVCTPCVAGRAIYPWGVDGVEPKEVVYWDDDSIFVRGQLPDNAFENCTFPVVEPSCDHCYTRLSHTVGDKMACECGRTTRAKLRPLLYAPDVEGRVSVGGRRDE